MRKYLAAFAAALSVFTLAAPPAQAFQQTATCATCITHSIAGVGDHTSPDIMHSHDRMNTNYSRQERPMPADALFRSIVDVSKRSDDPLDDPAFTITQPLSSRGERISATRLAHHVPKAAKKAYGKNTELLRKGELEASAEQLRKALEIDPLYMEAYNDLGCRYLSLGHPREALEKFEKAIELDPAADLVYSNKAFALLTLNQFADAEQASRHGLRLHPDDSKASYSLALSLYSQQKFTPELVSLLRKAQGVYQNAELLLATAVLRLGDRAQAKSILESYLLQIKGDKRKQATALLAAIK